MLHLHPMQAPVDSQAEYSIIVTTIDPYNECDIRIILFPGRITSLATNQQSKAA